MSSVFLTAYAPETVCPVYLLNASSLADFLSHHPAYAEWVSALDFKAASQSVCCVPSADGTLAAVLVGVSGANDREALTRLPSQLPPGVYQFAESPCYEVSQGVQAACYWGLGSYQFNAFLAKKTDQIAQLVLPSECDQALLLAWWQSVQAGQDWINTPASHMGPSQLIDSIIATLDEGTIRYERIVGEALLVEGYPSVHAVGRAGAVPPELLDLRWGDPAHPKLTLVGKGVCFDTGGLNLKTGAGMRQMKKDMGGAAHAAALAHLIIQMKLPVALRLLIPAVENGIGPGAYRPGDVVTTRAGLHIEIDNTDAEGRMVLCDALTAAVEESPDLLIDFATLTGAARIALGPDMPAFYSNDAQLSADIVASAERVDDPVWPMPLYAPYRRYLKSHIADSLNSSPVGDAGSITAALYLQQFVTGEIAWAHFDLSAWQAHALGGKHPGASLLAIRAVYDYLSGRYVQ